MRLLASVLVGVVVVAAFLAFFFMSSLLAFVDVPEQLLDSAEDNQVRERIVHVTAEYIADQVAADETLQPMSVPQLEVIIGGVISEQWMQTSLRGAHAALRAAFHGAEDSAVLDLRETKSALRTALANLRTQAGQSCKELWGPALCADQRASRVLIESFEIRALVAIDQIEDEIDLLRGLEGADRQRVSDLKDALESIHTISMLSLALLIMSLTIFIALGSRPIRILVLRVGLLSLIASALYLLAVAVGERFVQDGLVKGTSQLDSSHGSAQVQQLTMELMNYAIGSAMGGSTMPVAIIGVIGLGSVALVLLLSPRER